MSHPMTQKDRVLHFLRMFPEGICVTMLPTDLSYTARNRVCELRHDGFKIESKPCKQHAHQGSVVRWRLSAKPEQLVLV